MTTRLFSPGYPFSKILPEKNNLMPIAVTKNNSLALSSVKPGQMVLETHKFISKNTLESLKH